MTEADVHKEIERRIESAVESISEFVDDVVIIANVRNEDKTTELFSSFRGSAHICEASIEDWKERRKNQRLYEFLVEKETESQENGEL